ncbi:MAG: hypothetical protein PHAS_00001 [Phascolarctobacterium sp.]
MDAARFCQYLTAFDIFTVYTTQQAAYIVACYCFVQQFAEHFYAGYYCCFFLFSHTNDFNSIAYFDDTTLYTTSCYCTTAGDSEYVLYRHQERFVSCAFRDRNVCVYCVHQFHDFFFICCVAFQCFQRGAYDYRNVIAGEVIAGEKFANFHFYQFDQFRIVYHVCFVQEHYHCRYAYLTCQQDVLTCLRHRAVCCGYYQNSSVHLCCAGDHVFNIVGMARAIYVCVVAGCSFIFYVGSVDGDTAFSFFRCFIDHGVIHEFCAAFRSQHFGDCCGQGCFTMVNVTDSANISMRFGSFVFLLCHSFFLRISFWYFVDRLCSHFIIFAACVQTPADSFMIIIKKTSD